MAIENGKSDTKGIIPAHYSDDGNQYVELADSDGDKLEIVNGAVKVSSYTVKESFDSGDLVTNVYTIPNSELRYGFEIWNQGTTNLTFTINNITITVAPNATYSNEFDAFTTVTLSAGASFEAHTLGVRE